MSTMNVSEPASEGLHKGTRGSVLWTPLRPGHVLLTMFGRDDGDLTRFIFKGLEREIVKAGSVVLYVDTREMQASSASAREQCVPWYREHKDRWHNCHVLTRSKVVEMTTAVLNLVMGGFFKTYSDVGSFERAVRAEVPEFAGLAALEARKAKAAV